MAKTNSDETTKRDTDAKNPAENGKSTISRRGLLKKNESTETTFTRRDLLKRGTVGAGALATGGLAGVGSPIQTSIECPEGCDDTPNKNALTAELLAGEEPPTTPQPDEQNYSFTGSGQTATDTFELAGGLVMFHLSHPESSPVFRVTLVNIETGEETGMIHVIGGNSMERSQ